ncbi:DUF3105 domain-containing protein [Agromyces sp. SYSU T00194]|uniref:DUF3105 domain-containing protein n=1 Tax=Agromyces chitinivorans TaxID=3158560 RepID=UPI00339AF9D5
MSATPPGKKPTVKQQRAAQRAKKLEEYKRQQARAKRNRRLGIGAAIVGALAIAGVVVTSIVLAPQPANYSVGGSGAEVDGVETFDNTSLHVDGVVDYPQTPPAGGEHNPAWLNCGVYSEQVPSENAVHSMEHGAVWVTYDPSLADDELATLRSLLPSSYVILSPFEGLPSPIVLSGWNSQLQVESADDERIAQYLEEYWRSDLVPEPGALCTGGVDAPGRES